MWAGVLYLSRTELSTTAKYKQTMKAFNNVETAVQLATMAVDSLVFSGSIDDVKDHLNFNSSGSGFEIEVTDSLKTLITDNSSDRVSIKNRYLRVGKAANPSPDIIIRDSEGRFVGSVMISNDLSKAADNAKYIVGGSMGIADHGSSGSGSFSKQYYVITVSGKDPVAPGTESFYEVNGDEMPLSGPQTFLTVLYSVVKAS
jgi:hypothetical protein